jgi:hypothetical protein
MARLIPSDVDAAPWPGPEARTLQRLRDGLDDQYVVYHGVHWARAGETGSIYGEIDFIVQNRFGRLLAIEQKDTQIVLAEDDLLARYRGTSRPGDARRTPHDKSVTTQVNRNLNALRSECARRHPGLRLDIDHLLYLPTATLDGPLPSSVAPERVVDARRDRQLVPIIESLLAVRPQDGTATQLADLPRIEAFLSRSFGVVPHIGVLGDTARELTSFLSGGLSTWVGRLSLEPWRLRVQGTAGSGKTQLALDILREADERGQRACYVCFNRPLADAMKRIAPPSVTVTTFHELARYSAEGAGESLPAFDQPGAFDTLARLFLSLSHRLGDLFDTLVIDEGQDFAPEWVPGLLRLAGARARVLYLEDSEQTLYRREPIRLDGWVTLTSPVNYRSPRLLVEFINWLKLTDVPVEPGSAIEGFDPCWRVYPDEASLADETGQAVKDLVADGFAPDRIAVLSFRGLDSSRLVGPNGPERLAGYTLRRPIGYDAQGNARWSDGVLMIDTLFRFKGQAADAVVLTEVDFEEMDDNRRRRLFVAITRARVGIVLVTSAAADSALRARLAEGS